ncbi:hypothetical protein HanRHA438_Chr16g0785231 [Helianthus annuus]|nr:hypothetical protein HanIR_Chr16g0840961 [Helianthus annuus]KAJ0838094.1 hypothetical protein HanRHA438_Chr16g0785231 [Helianthus annuus]
MAFPFISTPPLSLSHEIIKQTQLIHLPLNQTQTIIRHHHLSAPSSRPPFPTTSAAA